MPRKREEVVSRGVVISLLENGHDGSAAHRMWVVSPDLAHRVAEILGEPRVDQVIPPDQVDREARLASNRSALWR